MAKYNLTGRGTQTLTPNTTYLEVDVTQFQPSRTVGNANPPNYFGVGLLRLGVAPYYLPAFPIDAVQQFVQLPAGVDIVGYDLFGSTAISITEGFGLLPGQNAGLPYWDRNPTNVILDYDQVQNSPVAQTVVLTHTVAAGRLGLILEASVEVMHYAAPTTAQVSVGWFDLNGSIFQTAHTTGAYVGYPFSDDIHTTGIPLKAADVVRGLIVGTDTGGSVRYTLNLVIVEFDP